VAKLVAECSFIRKLTMDTMLSKALREFMTGPLNQLIVNLAGQDGSLWEAELHKFNRKETCWPSERVSKALPKTSSQSLFVDVKNVTLRASAKKLTAECFTNRLRYYSRDGDLDKWLPKSQPAQAEQEFRAQELARKASFIEMLKYIFGTGGDAASDSKLLVEGGHTVALPKIEELIERQEKGDDVGLHTNGSANLFFVLNDDGTVSVVHVHRHAGPWNVYVHRLDYADRWYAEDRVFLRNS